MDIKRWIRVYGALIVVYGIYSLIGTGTYSQFSVLLTGIPDLLIVLIYIFSIFYGISCAYCGLRVLKLQNWARKTIIAFTSVSVILGFLLNKTVMGNFKDLIYSGQMDVPVELAGSVYKYMIGFVVLTTIFELSLVIFMDRFIKSSNLVPVEFVVDLD